MTGLLHDPPGLVAPGVGAPPLVRHGHRTVRVQGDGAAPTPGGLGLVGRVGEHFENQMPNPTGRVHARVPPNPREMIHVHGTRPVVRGVPPGGPRCAHAKSMPTRPDHPHAGSPLSRRPRVWERAFVGDLLRQLSCRVGNLTANFLVMFA
jgi:hypothetical protein